MANLSNADHDLLLSIHTVLIGLDGNGFIRETTMTLTEMRKEWHEFLRTREVTCPVAKRRTVKRSFWMAIGALLVSGATGVFALVRYVLP